MVEAILMIVFKLLNSLSGSFQPGLNFVPVITNLEMSNAKMQNHSLGVPSHLNPSSLQKTSFKHNGDEQSKNKYHLVCSYEGF
jgi:hypothetical protein